MKHSKRYVELSKLIDSKKVYPVAEAIELVKKTGTTKFGSSIEFHANLGIDIKKSDQQVRYTIVMPHTAGKTKKIAAFVPGDKEKEAKEAGAEIVGGEELVAEIAQSGKTDFDVAVATPDMMPKLAKLAKLLGPKGLMPNPKTETVGTNVRKMIEELKKGKVTVKNDSTGNIHQVVGKVSQSSDELRANIEMTINALRKAKPASAKGSFIKNAVLVSTMGPSVKIDLASV
jgi:large subunit ribosomal protein L1